MSAAWQTIFEIVCLLQKYVKTGMLYILKLVCLLQKYGENGYVVYIKTIMQIVERTELLYIVNYSVTDGNNVYVVHWGSQP